MRRLGRNIAAVQRRVVASRPRAAALGVVALASAPACLFDSGGVEGTASAVGEASSSADGSPAEGSSTAGADGGSLGSAGSGDAGGSSSSTGGTAADSTSAMADPCADGGGCDADASCTLDPSGEVAVCRCNDGFVGDGVSCELAPVFPPLRADSPCGATEFWSMSYCEADDVAVEDAFVGEPGVQYRVSLWVRGVLEEKSYDCAMPQGHWCEGGVPLDGGDAWNDTELAIAVPATIVKLNVGSSGGDHGIAIDEMHDVVIEGGSLLSLSILTLDDAQARNNDDVVIPGLPPAPDPYDGQFVAVEAVAIERLP